MSLAKKVDIEPLQEARWARLERSLFSSLSDDGGLLRRDTPELGWPLRWRAGTAFVLAGALAAAVGALAWRSLAPPDGHSGPTRIETASNGSHVEIGESTVDVGPKSTVRVTGDDVHGINVRLDTGRVECDVAPRRGRPPFLVEAGAVEVRVVGTHFVVNRVGNDVTVDVQHGQVEVTSGAQHAMVAAGTHWPPLPPSPPSGNDVPKTPSQDIPSADMPPTPHSPTSEGRGTAMGSPRLTPREQYEAASRAEARQPDVAIASYADLARQGGSWGMNALYAEGRLQADRDHRDEARRLLRDYLGRYPTGPNAEDARRLLERLR